MDKPVFFRYDNDSGILYRICKYRHFSPPGKKQKESRAQRLVSFQNWRID